MRIETFVIGIGGVNCYYVINEDTKEAVVVDPGAYPKRVRSFIEKEGIDIKAILLTHGHFDHIMGLKDMEDALGNNIPIYIHEKEIYKLSDAKANHSATYTDGYVYETDLIVPVKDGDVLDLIGYSFQVIYTPGHTIGGCCYYVKSEDVLFAGDTLFRANVGRCDFEDGDIVAIKKSIREKLFLLPDDTKVLPGHDMASTIGWEKIHNPYVNEEDLV
ncbi:MAG: MBL fold metallo-hydrolase [Lachnospiraceae bacterium]|nr:MBL fold metallo-hydrolase [Lachnospiraceae bacterium]